MRTIWIGSIVLAAGLLAWAGVAVLSPPADDAGTDDAVEPREERVPRAARDEPAPPPRERRRHRVDPDVLAQDRPVGADPDREIRRVLELVVRGHHLPGQSGVQTDQGIQALGDHGPHHFEHALEVEGHTDGVVGREVSGTLRDVDGQIPHALEIVVDLHDGDHESEIGRHGLV